MAAVPPQPLGAGSSGDPSSSAAPEAPRTLFAEPPRGATPPSVRLSASVSEEEVPASGQLPLPLRTRPYWSGKSPKRDEDGWAPLPDASEARGDSWDLLVSKCKEEQEKSRLWNRKVRAYHEDLLKHVEELHEADMLTKATGDFQGSKETVAGVKFIYVSLAVNGVIFAVKAFTAVTSGSLVLLASALDSLLDLLSGSALGCMAVMMNRQNKYKFPVGKTRMEPLGVVVFATLMGSCSLQVLVESAKRLIEPEPVLFTTRVWVLLVLVIASKGILLVLGRRLLAKLEQEGASVGALEAQTDDHRNDIITNGLSLVGAYLASATFANAVGIKEDLLLSVDPAAAILFSLYVMKNWAQTAIEQMTSLVGKAAPPDLLSKITYITCTHCAEVLAVDTVRAFTFGPRYIAEVDIVLPPDMTMRVAHDIGESLQIRIESLAEIERCYVHLDWETDHRPEHKSTV